MKEENNQDFWIAIGPGIGGAIGTLLGILTENIGLCIAVGVSLGSAFGIIMRGQQTKK